MKNLPYIVFCFLMLCALCTSISSYHRTEYMIAQDVNQALKQVLVKMGPLEKVCGYRSTIKILFCPFIKLNNG